MKALHIQVKGPQGRGWVQFLTLDGRRIGFETRYSAREGRFYAWILDTDGARVVGPRKLVGGVDIWAGSKHDARVPQGAMFVQHDDREPMTLANADVDARLLYRGVAT